MFFSKIMLSIFLLFNIFILPQALGGFLSNNNKTVLSFYCKGDFNYINSLKCRGEYQNIKNKLIPILNRFEYGLNNIKNINKLGLYKKLKIRTNKLKNKEDINIYKRFVYVLLDNYFANKIKNYHKKGDISIENPIENKICTAQYDPVCGVNGKTYKTFGNLCSLNNNPLYNFSYKGECSKNNSPISSLPVPSTGSLMTEKVLFLKTPERDLYMNVVHLNDGVKKPAIIVIHGGGWIKGDEDMLVEFAKKFANKGYFVITPTYRYSTEKPFPAQINDVKESYNWLFENAEKYNIDTENIGVYGSSAGAHLALLLGLNNNLNIKAIISQMGPTDFRTIVSDKKKLGVTEEEILSKIKNLNSLLSCDVYFDIGNCSTLDLANPINHYDKLDPPILLLQGTADTTVPYLQAIKFRDFGVKNGNQIELILEEGIGHSSELRVLNSAKIYSFYDKYLKNSVKTPVFKTPIVINTKKNNFGHYMFINTSDISKNIDKIKNNSNILGIQKTYYWKDLEKSKDVYDFSSIRNDLNLLKKYNKNLVLQFQIKSFNNDLVLIPNYLLTPEYGGGIYKVINKNNNKNGTNAVIWNENLKSRYIKILNELAKEFDNDINFEAITLNETAISTDTKLLGSNYSAEAYYLAITDIMKGAKNSFKNSSVIQYVNFLPNNNDIVRIYNFAKINNIGIGGPDVYVNRGKLLNTTNSEVAKLPSTMTIGYAIQWNDYTQIDKDTGKKVAVNDIYNFAKTTLKSDYYFWLNREPYFTNEVLPIINNN